MSGHSKWANIQYRKSRQDAMRGQIFTKLIRAITVAAKKGGGDIDKNPTLRTAVDKALAHNMSRDTINRAIKRGGGEGEEINVEEIYYEGYGPNGVAILIECLTDNRNRTVAEVRHAFSKYGGRLGTTGSVAYLFDKQGVITFAPGSDEDKIMEIALDAGANDVKINEDGSIDVITSVDDFAKIKDAIAAENVEEPDHAEISMIPNTEITLDPNAAEKLLNLVNMLEELDDVQCVHHNADISEEILEKWQ
jgi:YebC/PmpR family DNA-binding regulatory protein